MESSGEAMRRGAYGGRGEKLVVEADGRGRTLSEWRPDWYPSYVTFEIKGVYEEHHPTAVAGTISEASGVGVLAWWDFDHEWMTVSTIVERPKAMRVWRELVKWCEHEGVKCRVGEWMWRPIGK